ncbi:hypothetical protein JQV19_08465 [Sulfitobacter mediterraneus]|uniref:hypothetical protein n=1 Tax=Sulfitobacter mediterraneus TaxID=83219 RepID=UPI00193AC05D|nr:hypothetical protein [Sulfitobacter mediterraneus]MBM1556679.1 hypothetical protein [Sulfitobacter mediterraneus]MBM1570124.1 hypothetical protein [Sulfitobacter mediterraneus]MBM1574081.1 hypothetical protein [Sulfitobacter mediterraneus]MBM1577866.1 hypothetical protein [Sulfitobacter mediterraneus]MBM1579637.1 hypothetical protein [Sulfitobacter mediterraneus]
MTPEEAEQLQAQNATQEQTIKELWVQNAALQNRVDKLQSMYDHSQAYITKLEYERSAIGLAEQLFKGAAQ